MKSLTYITGNPSKFTQAQTICTSLGVNLQQATLDLSEIQAENGEAVARDKAEKAFAQTGTPLVVSDDSWAIPGLNGFPGPYMQYMNQWFTAEDWLRLTSALANRDIILRQVVVYQDEHQQKIFSKEVRGILLMEIRGNSPKTHDNIVSFDGGQTTIGEHVDRGKSAATDQVTAWHELAEWFRERP